ncbi:hypothetical protein BpHYR1_005159 [Brachionus plicatilis]|uniref:Uncharacterized protein n=1 Tax=Brachionus plicatilis TaxID=10195 RepID=A0A3M7R1J6_BRAPC|nr:hypothetical protein BpHYR1_005159 [Brachionus plicatilis]
MDEISTANHVPIRLKLFKNVYIDYSGGKKSPSSRVKIPLLSRLKKLNDGGQSVRLDLKIKIELHNTIIETIKTFNY